MHYSRLLFSVILYLVSVLTASADNLTAEFQTRLKLLGEQPGVIDGAFGSKTNAAANNYFKTSNKNYRDMMSDANQTLINHLKQTT